MESRFLRFVANKRSKDTNCAPNLGVSNTPYQTSSPAESRSKLVNHFVGKIVRSPAPEEQDDSLKTVSYDCVAPRSLPIFGDKPHKGNGPIKLQTNRRLSSGELEVTSDEDYRILEEIRDGSYIVGQKQSRETHVRSSPSSTISSPAVRQNIFSPSSSNRTSSGTSITARSSPASHCFNPPCSPTTNLSECCSSYGALNVIDEDRQLSNIALQAYETDEPIESPAQTSAIISALYKAEYNRLVKIYVSEGVDCDMAQIQLQLRQSQAASRGRAATPVTLAIGSLPPPGSERRSFDSTRGSRTSGRSSSYYSDASSSERVSMASSYMASSVHTTRTSTVEGEPPAAADEIRRMVREMRSTYLRALETQVPPPVKPKSVRKRRQRRTGKSPLTKSAGAMSPPMEDRQTWHGTQSAPSSDDKSPKSRATSNPVIGLGVTTINEALLDDNASVSPTPFGLQRADSTTLGGPVREPRVIKPTPSQSLTTPKEDETCSSPDDDEWAQFDIPDSSLMFDQPGEKILDASQDTNPLGMI